MEDLRDKLKLLFYERAPNLLLFEHIADEFPAESQAFLSQTLTQLTTEGFLQAITEKNALYPNLIKIKNAYRIAEIHLRNYPIKTTIQVGTLTVSRHLDGGQLHAEELNLLALRFNLIVAEKVAEIRSEFEQERRRYWASLATLFGIFVAVFSLVNLSVKPIYYAENLKLSAEQILWQSVLNFGPLLLVLTVLTLILALLLFKRT